MIKLPSFALRFIAAGIILIPAVTATGPAEGFRESAGRISIRSIDNMTGGETMGDFGYSYVDVPEREWQAIELICRNDDRSVKKASALVTADEGSNLYGFRVDGAEYLCGFGGEKLFGTPVLYPTPNRVRDARFEFAGKLFTFPANNGANFIHGLVRNIEWERDEPVPGNEGVALRTRVAMTPESGIFELFPIRNSLEITYSLGTNSMRLDFTVRNEDAVQDLPFGLAIHPFFPIHGSREEVRLEVPARKWMEAENLLPSGKLMDLSEGPADLSRPVSLADLDLDVVFWGMEEERPSVIYYDALGKKLVLSASSFFTHCVVYTPPGAPYFCIENQSCSTDAHNLYAGGMEEAAHLTILKPGESLSAWVELTVTDL